MKYLWLVLIWSGWCAGHSLLITPAVIRWMKNRLGGGFRFFRLFYNLFAIFSLGAVWIWSRSIQGPVLFDWPGWTGLIRWGMLLCAFALFAAGARRYSWRRFAGIQQIREGGSGLLLTSGDRLNIRGIFRFIRHPWYTATFLLIWSRTLTLPALISNLILSIYLIIGTRLEENKLITDFGDEYRQYRQQVSMYLPLRWFRKKIFNYR